MNYGKPDSQRQTNMNFTFKPKINNYSSNIVSRASSGYGQSNSRRNISNANSRRVMNQLIHRDKEEPEEEEMVEENVEHKEIENTE